MTRPTLDTFLAHPRFQYVQINLQENMLKSMLVSLFRASIRRAVPPALHPTYLVSSQSMEYLRDPLGLDNKHIGWVQQPRLLRLRQLSCSFVVFASFLGANVFLAAGTCTCSTRTCAYGGRRAGTRRRRR